MAIAPANECIPYYRPGGDITAYVATAVTGKRCVKISADRQAGPALNTSVSGGNVTIVPATAAGRIFGVAHQDAAVGDVIKVHCNPGEVVPITAGGSIAAFAEVEVGTGGQVVTLASGVAIGVCLSAVTSTNDAQIKLY